MIITIVRLHHLLRILKWDLHARMYDRYEDISGNCEEALMRYQHLSLMMNRSSIALVQREACC